MTPFEKHFHKSLINEAKAPKGSDEVPVPSPGEPTDTSAQVPDVNPQDDSAAWQGSLEPGSDPKDFEGKDNPEFGVVTQNIDLVKSWVGRIEEFRHFINGVDGDSLNCQINKLDRAGSVFKGLVRSEENRIIRIAEDCAGLAEVFKAYMIGSEKKIRDMRER